MTVLPSARVKLPVSDAMTLTFGLSFVASAKPDLRSLAGAEPVVPCELDDVDRLGAGVGDVLSDPLALLDEVGPDERLVERLVLGVDRAVGEDHGDVRGLGLLEDGVPAGLDHGRERDVVDALRDVGPDRLDLVLLLLLRVGELRSNPASAVRVSWMDLVLAARQPLSEPTWLKPTVIASPPSDRRRRRVAAAARLLPPLSLAHAARPRASAATPAATARVLNFLLTIVILLLENDRTLDRPCRPVRAADPSHGIREHRSRPARAGLERVRVNVSAHITPATSLLVAFWSRFSRLFGQSPWRPGRTPGSSGPGRGTRDGSWTRR